jgi:phage baseplate assembly protein W
MSFIVATSYRTPPRVWEIAQPFNIDETGEVAFDNDPYLWARNHVLSLLLTSPGERVMRPTYGAGIRSFVWENNDPFVEQQLIVSIRAALSDLEPNVKVADIKIVPQPPDWGTVEIRMAITVGNAPTPRGVTFTLSGFAAEVTA